MLIFAIILILFGSIFLFFSFSPYFTEIKNELQKLWLKEDHKTDHETSHKTSHETDNETDLNKNQKLAADLLQNTLKNTSKNIYQQKSEVSTQANSGTQSNKAEQELLKTSSEQTISQEEEQADLHIQGFLYQDFSNAVHKTSASLNNIAHFIKCLKKLRREGRAYLVVNKDKIELKTKNALYTYSAREFEEFVFYPSGVALVPLISSRPNYIFLASNIQQLKSYIKEHSHVTF